MTLKSLEISPWVAWIRKIRVLTTVTRFRRGGVLTAEDFSARVGDLQEKARAEGSIHCKIGLLWQIEGLAYRYFHGNADSASLKGCLGAEAGPPAHCGLGMASVINCGFNAPQISRFLEQKADPDFVRAAYESVGVMLAACEHDFFGSLTALLGRLKLIRRPSHSAPNPGKFLQGFHSDARQFISHGFGRLLYFKCHRLSAAVARARRTKFLPTQACIHGVVGAYTLVNSGDLERVLLISEADEEPVVAEAISAGLFNTLLLLEWTSPGCLADLTVRTSHAQELLARATEFARWAKTQGRGPIFVA